MNVLRCDFPDVKAFQLISPNEWKDYTCTFCMSIVRDPLVHITAPHCPSIFCNSCFHTSLRYTPHQSCPFRCNGNEELQYAVERLPLFSEPGKRSLNALYNLKLVCKFQGCGAVLKYYSYQQHLDDCSFNDTNGKICVNCNVIVKGHNCQKYIENLKKDNAALLDGIAQMESAFATYRKLVDKAIAELRIEKLEEAQQPKGMMNNICSTTENRENSSIVLRFGSNVARFDGIKPDMKASELRQRIEDHFNTQLGSIIRVDYTILGTHQYLWKHQRGNLPSAWIALPENQLLTDGQLVPITIGNFSNTV